LHMAQLMPLPLTVSCSSKIQIGFTFLVPAYPGCPGKEAVKWLKKILAVYCHEISQTLHYSLTARVIQWDFAKVIQIIWNKNICHELSGYIHR